MDINTINEIFLPAFLFAVVFCFLCCQLPRPCALISIDTTTTVVETDEAISTLEESVEALAPAHEPAHEVENVPVINNPVAVVLEPVQAPPTVTPSSYEQALTVINGLTKVQLRKLCKPLGIQQKRNDVELTKDLMAANIKKVLKSNEQLVISTIVQKLDIEIAVAKEESIESIASA